MAGIVQRLYGLALAVFRRLPVTAKRFVVRRVAPTFTVGAMAVVQRADGALLLLRQSYRVAWGLPGGLLGRGETPAETARRETMEEVGLEVEPIEPPAVVVTPSARRVDIVFRCEPVGDPEAAHLTGNAEIVEISWFPTGRLPELQPEAADGMAALARVDGRLRSALGGVA